MLSIACGDDTAPGTGDSSSTGTSDGPTSSATLDPDTGTSNVSMTSIGTDGSSSSATTTADSSGTADGSTGGTTGGSGSSDGSSSSGVDGSSSSGDASTGAPALPDISGDHLFAVAIAIDASHPLQYLATIVQTPDGDGATLDVSLQPLTLDVGSTTDPRLPLGAPIAIDAVPVAADGTFTMNLDALAIDGQTNPITGSDAAAVNLVFDGQLVDDDNWCGTMAGDLTQPLMLDLAGSTFAGSRAEGALPLVFPSSC